MRLAILLLPLTPLALATAASSRTAPPVVAAPVQSELGAALAEARAAEAAAQRYEREAQAALNDAARMRLQQSAAVESIAAAEARIGASEARLRLTAAALAAQRRALARQREPAAALMAGLALMAARPPLLAILDEGSTREFIHVRLLLDHTLPEVRRRTAALSLAVERTAALRERAARDLAALDRERRQADRRRAEFAALERQALRLAGEYGAGALGAGDVALARAEALQQARDTARSADRAGRVAAELAAIPPVPPSPFGSSEPPTPAPLLYLLPSDAPVIEGFGSVSAAGIRSRGVTLGSRRGSPVQAPAGGTVRFSGPFRSWDGIVIIDHGGGWTSLLLNVAATIPPGTRVRAGQPLGRALGPVGVELSRNGNHVSPALIAGSSRTLSKAGRNG
jgi:murein hydrolase activator